jgi:hypothetical protein
MLVAASMAVQDELFQLACSRAGKLLPLAARAASMPVRPAGVAEVLRVPRLAAVPYCELATKRLGQLFKGAQSLVLDGLS